MASSTTYGYNIPQVMWKKESVGIISASKKEIVRVDGVMVISVTTRAKDDGVTTTKQNTLCYY